MMEVCGGLTALKIIECYRISDLCSVLRYTGVKNGRIEVAEAVHD